MLKRCRECGQQVSSKANRCPHCGIIIKQFDAARTFLLFFIVMFVLWIIAGLTRENWPKRKAPTIEEDPRQPASTVHVW
jgi:hypothetical protein